MKLESSHSSYYINTGNKKIPIYCVLPIILEVYALTIVVGTNWDNSRNHELCILSTSKQMNL